METLNDIKRVYSRLAKSGKDGNVLAALDALLLAPGDINLQINVIGATHRAYWLPARKAALWRAFTVGSEQWVNRCVARVAGDEGADDALYALLGCGVTATATIVQRHSPDLVQVWDVNGARACGIGLAQHRGGQFLHYFYIGWRVGTDTVSRLDYISSIQTPAGYEDKHLNKIVGRCETSGGSWAELPYGFGSWPTFREFSTPADTLQPHGFTMAVRRQLSDLS